VTRKLEEKYLNPNYVENKKAYNTYPLYCSI